MTGFFLYSLSKEPWNLTLYSETKATDLFDVIILLIKIIIT